MIQSASRAGQLGARLSGPGQLAAIQLITASDEDRDRELASLAVAGLYDPGQLVIDHRIVRPDPRRKDLDHQLRGLRSETDANQLAAQ